MKLKRMGSMSFSRFIPYFIAAAAVGGLAFLAARSQNEAPGSSPWLVGMDLAVGLAFILSAALASGPEKQRVLVASVGILWLIGSILPAARLTHQTGLAAALVAFPSGLPKGAVRWGLIGLAILVGFGLVPQPGTAALFGAIGLIGPWASMAWRYRAGSAFGLASVLAGSWWLSRMNPAGLDPSLALMVYEMALLLIAAAFPFAAAGVIASRAKLADQILGDQALTGLAGFETVLAEALHDRDIRIRTDSVPVGERPSLPVTDKGSLVAIVEYSTPALEDPTIAEAVASAVRLAARREKLEGDTRAQLVELQSASTRLVAAADRERETTARRLVGEVVTPLRQATTALDTVRVEVGPGEASEALDIVAQELTAAGEEILAMVSGVPPLLGNGRLRDAIHALARRSAVPVTVNAYSSESDMETETTLYYVCSEALTNAVKHAHARHIEILLAGTEDQLTLLVSDDGGGGADVTGSGLQGLADRLAAKRGRLRVESTPGAGTTVIATVPR